MCLKWVSKCPLIQVLFKNFWKQKPWLTIKINFSHICKKSGHAPGKIPHKLPFFSMIWAFFRPRQFQEFYFHTSLTQFQSLTQTFVCLKKISDKHTKSGISLKFSLTNCVSYCQCNANSALNEITILWILHSSFLVCITNEAWSTKNR